MQAPDHIESVLARLMPTALSHDGQAKIEAMLDDLACHSRNEVPAARFRWVLGAGIAAAIGMVCAVFPWSGKAPGVVQKFADKTAAGLVLISESSRVESMTDEGWREDADGAAMQAVRLNVVDENSLRDEETGMIVHISEPREEILLTPVSAF